jgi:hypothetical protein
MRTSS